MVSVENLLNTLKKNNITFFSGVPDSVLKHLSTSFNKFNSKKHKLAVNEGSAVAMGIGHYLETKKIPCVYMQNSGLGNAINPLISIAHQKVYSIPMVLLIGWRGAPGETDEPQHMVKGKITKKLLGLLNIKFCVLDKETDLKKFDSLIKNSKKNNSIVACLIKNKILTTKLKNKKRILKQVNINRDIFILNLLKTIKKKTKIISTTGYTSRAVMKTRLDSKLYKGKDFYMVGGMGHSLSVSLGMSLQSKNNIICLDGDGSILMHMGSLFSGGFNKNINLKHILFNNNVHESVGGQSTNAKKINFKLLSKSLGYKKYYKLSKNQNIKKIIKKFLNEKCYSFLEVITDESSDNNLPRPKDLIKIKLKFIN
jgi:phosphonopyruvate decarboxylase